MRQPLPDRPHRGPVWHTQTPAEGPKQGFASGLWLLPLVAMSLVVKLQEWPLHSSFSPPKCVISTPFLSIDEVKKVVAGFLNPLLDAEVLGDKRFRA